MLRFYAFYQQLLPDFQVLREMWKVNKAKATIKTDSQPDLTVRRKSIFSQIELASSLRSPALLQIKVLKKTEYSFASNVILVKNLKK